MNRSKLALIAGVMALGACAQGGGEQAQADNAAQPQPQQQQQQQQQVQQVQADARAQERSRARQEIGELRFTVDLSDRKVRVYRGQQLVREHDVAVGTEEYPTPTGSWNFTQVDINPDWTPPDSEWAEGETKQAPGAPGNPMGRARLIFNMPYTIHGTTETESLGNAESHGSIRAANPVVLELAQLLLRSGGAWEGDDWFRNMTSQRNQMFEIPLPDPVPIEVVE